MGEGENLFSFRSERLRVVDVLHKLVSFNQVQPDTEGLTMKEEASQDCYCRSFGHPKRVLYWTPAVSCLQTIHQIIVTEADLLQSRFLQLSALGSRPIF
jgi:hypothetical protein